MGMCWASADVVEKEACLGDEWKNNLTGELYIIGNCNRHIDDRCHIFGNQDKYLQAKWFQHPTKIAVTTVTGSVTFQL